MSNLGTASKPYERSLAVEDFPHISLDRQDHECVARRSTFRAGLYVGARGSGEARRTRSSREMIR